MTAIIMYADNRDAGFVFYIFLFILNIVIMLKSQLPGLPKWFLLSFTFHITRKYWNSEKFWLPVFNRLARFGML